MKTIKIIDLLNKIANEEEVPHFKINEDEYYLGADGLLKDVYGDAVEWFIYQKWLNEEVEIIEEEKEIEKLDYKVEQLENPSHNESLLMNMIRENKETINKLIEKLKRDK